MKDNAVEPAGLFDVRRQRRLLDGLVNRFRGSLSKQQMLHAAHTQQRSVEESRFGQERAKIANECRIERRSMLESWEHAEERSVRTYEAKTVEVRRDLNRLAAVYRKKNSAEKQVMERKVAARHQAIQHQFDNRKHQPGQQSRKEIQRISEALEPIEQMLEQARELALRRLDHVPEVGPPESTDDDDQPPQPENLDDVITAIRSLSEQCQNALDQMRTTTASKIVDSYMLPLGVIVFLALWCLAAFLLVGGSPLWMVAGVIPAGVIGFGVYLALMMPLKTTTRRQFPAVQRIGLAAQHCANIGKQISTDLANEAKQELVQRRDNHLESTKRWMHEQLVLLDERLESEQAAQRSRLQAELEANDQRYIAAFAEVDRQMRSQAETLAEKISRQLSSIDETLRRKRESSAASRQRELEYLTHRLTHGIRLGIERMNETSAMVDSRFPAWDQLLDPTADPERGIDFLPLGRLQVEDTLRRALKADPGDVVPPGNGSTTGPIAPPLLGESQLSGRIPVALHRRLYSAVVIRSPANQLPKAVDLAHALLWRLLTGSPPALAKLTLIDPLGRGQNFTEFMALADRDPTIVGHRVWTTDGTIDTRLSELAHHVEDVLQSSLRDRFQRIEDYNQVAGSMAEPYRAVAAIGFPDSLSRNGYRHLSTLIESGLRCGIFTILVCDRDKPWPDEMPMPGGDKVLTLEIGDSGHWRLAGPGFEQIPFEPECAPPQSVRDELIKKIGAESIAASRVEIPLQNLLSTAEEGTGCTDDGVNIVIGSQGANRTLNLALGEGVRQHVLIAGKTGSGKSTLLHSIITSGAHHYRPDQLQFYLLDFKKGVEFKPYADIGLPHARVIGIESEREFGRSVLQRLDAELQQRGEAFRGCGAQDLGEYRRNSGATMPRIMLVIDEFQELFVRDDRLAGDCAMLLDRLVRQGRSFGMHVVLSSQSLAGAYSLPRATLGQMAVRIAMQCSESDATLILSDENTAARLISRPGEAIYNDAGGLLEGNQPFQVAWLASDRHREMLEAMTARDQSFKSAVDRPVVFEGNQPCRWTPQLANHAIDSSEGSGMRGLLGESVEIGPPLSLELVRETGRNALLIASAAARQSILAAITTGLAKQAPNLEVVYFDGARADDTETVAPWIERAGVQTRIIKPRDSETVIAGLAQMIKERGDERTDTAPIIVIIDPLERFRDLRQDDSFNFSLDTAADSPLGGDSLQTILRDGPPAGVHVILVCGSAETLSRWLPRSNQHDLELRILGQMNQSDSSLLIDSPAASELSAATLLLYDDSDGRITKFRQCELPDAAVVRQWLQSAN